MIDLYQEQQRQRFVDGELTIAEENDAIIQCELDPELWQNIGLAMIEQRRIATALASLRENRSPTADSHGHVELARKTPVSSAIHRVWIPLAASLVVTVFLSVFAYQAGQRNVSRQFTASVEKVEAVRSSVREAVNYPVIVRVEYPSDPRNTFANGLAQRPNLFNAQVREALREGGYGVDEKTEWELVEDGDRMKVVPIQQVQFVSLQD